MYGQGQSAALPIEEIKGVKLTFSRRQKKKTICVLSELCSLLFRYRATGLHRSAPAVPYVQSIPPSMGMLNHCSWWTCLMGCALVDCWLVTLVYSEQHRAETQHPRIHRVKRKWVWNQFFAVEENTEKEPLRIGKIHSNSDTGNGTLRYTLSGEGAGTIFTINEDKGDIYVMKKLDREEKPSYTLRAQVVNRATNQYVEPESEFNIKVQDINDNEPRFLDGPYVATVPEMSPDGTSVTQVTATDADDPSYGSHARIVYRILQGQPYFLVEPTTGIIRVAMPNMDRLVKEHHLVIVEAMDMAGLKGGFSGTTTVTITLSDVNDNGPKFQHKLYHFTVLESTDIGTTVGRVLATDADTGQNAEMVFSVEGSDGSDLFNIVADGQTQEGIIILKKALDYESKRWFSLRVQAINKHIDPRFLQLGPFKDVTNVKISVLDVDEPPLFLSPTYTFRVQENREPGAPVGKVSARDPDAASNSIRYSIDRGTGMDSTFHIDAFNGTITTSQSLDREEVAWYNLSILAAEVGDSEKVTSVLVQIGVLDKNDHPPVFPIPYETFVCENAKYGQLIQTISAVDKDDPLEGQYFHFTLAADVGSNPNFTVSDNQDNSASILTRTVGFNRREQAVHLLPIVIEDSGDPSLSSTNTLTVLVCKCSNNGVGQLCNTDAFLLPAGLSTGALIAVVVCILMILAIVLLLLILRQHRKEPDCTDDVDDVRENIVRYDDEGGGEEDTRAFNMAALRGPDARGGPKVRVDVTAGVRSAYRRSLGMGPDAAIFREFIRERLRETDTDPSALPFDSLQTYAFEGSGSVASSLSSMSSLASISHLSYDHLRDWGPRFYKLAELYGNCEPVS
ncbi:cadherin-7-like [Leucoraja erinacea]|uniref:cadherin-7-like n=1 Tax=Leucoraja erinaceus TaxID=7782 RepID=UPI0024584B63|nr:cadherin-7-like [Leucoraja erinacea]